MGPGAQPPVLSKGKAKVTAKAKTKVKAEIDVQMLRRSIRIRELKK